MLALFEPIVRAPPPPSGPGFGTLGATIVLLTIAAFVARRFAKRGTKRAARLAAFSVAVGNALLDLAAMLQPDRPRAAEILKVKEQRAATADGDRDPPKPS